jgi:selenocysteine lyase/cysteine desulfurase
VLTTLEHHSNIVPWQMVAEEKGARIRVVPVNDRGELVFEEYLKLLGPRTRLVGVGHVSNALGTINPVREMIAAAHERGVPVLLDGAQAAPHMQLDMQALDCDFYAFSGHKMFGPTGIGVLYGKAAWLEKMQPYKGGGDMILSVTFEKTVYNVIPGKFEAGTPPIAAAIALGAAADYIRSGEPPAGRAHRRHRGEEGGGAVLRGGRRASARRRHAAERGRHRGPHRAPLRAAGHAAIRHSRHLARLVRLLQHARGSGRAGRRHPEGPENAWMTRVWRTASSSTRK